MLDRIARYATDPNYAVTRTAAAVRTTDSTGLAVANQVVANHAVANHAVANHAVANHAVANHAVANHGR